MHICGPLLQGLTRLQQLDIHSNHISSLASISTLVSLQSLNAAANQLQQLPCLTKLTCLTQLNLRHNMLTQLTGAAAAAAAAVAAPSSNDSSNNNSSSKSSDMLLPRSLRRLSLACNQLPLIGSLTGRFCSETCLCVLGEGGEGYSLD
jgi:Leucine-rich repeat (LRR) protein